MRTTRLFIVIGLLLVSTSVFAQQRDGSPIERQMSADEFKAAGLGKLSAEELARLNVWLNRTVVQESKKAVAEAKREEATSNAGLFNLGGSDPFEAHLVGSFNGFERGKKYTLDNGQVWQQVDDATMYGVKLENPSVRLRPSVAGSTWYMRVDGRAVNAKVKRIK